MLVQQGDDIYTSGPWDASPIVLEEFKLVFFTTAKVGCTVWKMLFRRMMGLPNWKAVNTRDMLPWNPHRNGLKYLYDYNRTYASFLMTDPEWTRAIFVRDPKERLLSAYLDKGKNQHFIKSKCCPSSGNCTHCLHPSSPPFSSSREETGRTRQYTRMLPLNSCTKLCNRFRSANSL